MPVWSWRDLVTKADPDFEYEGQHPIVYRFGANPRRDAGAQAGIYTFDPANLAAEDGVVLITEDDQEILLE